MKKKIKRIINKKNLLVASGAVATTLIGGYYLYKKVYK